MKIKLNDPWLGEREIDDDPLSIIKDQIQVLKVLRDDGQTPSQHLLDDIKIYEFILAQPDADKFARDYMQMRVKLGAGVKKERTAEALGWNWKGEP